METWLRIAAFEFTLLLNINTGESPHRNYAYSPCYGGVHKLLNSTVMTSDQRSLDLHPAKKWNYGRHGFATTSNVSGYVFRARVERVLLTLTCGIRAM